MKFKTEKLVLEGPDLTGKTSLYNEIHRKTNFSWNVQDRSCLSMVCYARQFNRSTEFLRRSLYKEVSNLNNRIVILLPCFEVIKNRYNSRGDEVQDLTSLQDLYKIFKEEVDKIRGLPNVLVIKDEISTSNIADSVIGWINSFEECSSFFVGDTIRTFVEESSGDEHVVSLECSGVTKQNYSNKILDDPLEGDYYKNIEKDFCEIISKELSGLNEYNKPQNMRSRRFYYASRSCISSLHAKPRGRLLELICTFRSTDAQKNASIDFQFLEYLVHKLSSDYFSMCEFYRINLNMNSVHLRYDNAT